MRSLYLLPRAHNIIIVMNEGFDFKKWFADIKRHLKLEISYGKLTAVEKTSVLLSRSAIVAVLVILGCFALFYLSSSLVDLLAIWTGAEWAAKLIMCVIMLVLMLMVYAFRKQWIVNPITKFVSKLFLKPNDNE